MKDKLEFICIAIVIMSTITVLTCLIVGVVYLIKEELWLGIAAAGILGFMIGAVCYNLVGETLE